MAERIPDEAVVVRGGRNLPADLRRGTRTHPSGVTGASVECAEGMSVEELAAVIPHGQIGVTHGWGDSCGWRGRCANLRWQSAPRHLGWCQSRRGKPFARTNHTKSCQEALTEGEST